MTITVYGSMLSPYNRKVEVCMLEKGIKFENVHVNPFAPPDWFAEISPIGKIPVIRDTSENPDAILADSSVICAYLERKYPEPALYPSDPFAFARALWFEEFSDTVLVDACRPFFLALVMQPLQGREVDRKAADDAVRNKMPPRFSYLNKELVGKEYFVGDRMTIADISLACIFVNYKLAGGSLDSEMYPDLAAFVERMHSRPSYHQYIMEEKAFLSKALHRTC